MFPCSFIDNQYSYLRTSYVNSDEITQSIEEIKDISFALIVDNTNFPFPHGSYSYSPINIDLSVNLELDVSSSYRDMGNVGQSQLKNSFSSMSPSSSFLW